MNAGVTRIHWAALGLMLLAYRTLINLDPISEASLDEAEAVLYDATSAAPIMVFGLTAGILYSRRAKLVALTGRQSATALSALALSLSALLYCWSYYVTLSYLLVSSLSLLLLGGALLLGGIPLFRVMLFPALFLFLALPLPTVLVNHISYPMQVTNAQITEWILTQVGLTAMSVGDQVHYGQHIFQVIEGCIGLRSMHTLFMASLIYTVASRRVGVRAWLLVLSSPLIALVINEIRILSIVLYPSATISSVHTIQGVIMIVIGVLMIAGLDSALGRFNFGDGERVGPSIPKDLSSSARAKEWGGLIALLSVLLLVSVALPKWEAPDLTEPRLSRLSSARDGWTVTSRLPFDTSFFGSTRFSQTMLRVYERGDDRVEVFMGLDDRLGGSNRAHSFKTVVPGSGWTTSGAGPNGSSDAGWYVARSVVATQLIYHRNLNMGSLPAELARSLLGLGRGPFRRPGRSIALRVSTRVAQKPQGMALAKRRLDKFLTSFAEPLALYTD